MPTTASYDGETTKGGGGAAAAAASRRVVEVDGDRTNPARANVNRLRTINKPRVRVIHPLLLEEPTSFAPCRRFVLSHHRCCSQASSFRCCMQLSCLRSGQGLRAETHYHRHGPPTTRCSERRSSSSLYGRCRLVKYHKLRRVFDP